MPKVIKADNFRYLTNDDWRTLIGVEMGMKNHELVPLELIHRISKVKRRGQNFEKILRDTLGPGGLVAYEQAGKTRCGYRLTNLGYDYLALHQLYKSQQVADLRNLIGTGKESDVYVALAGELCGQENEDLKNHRFSKLSRIRSDPSESSSSVMPSNFPETDKTSHFPDYMDPIVIKFHRLGRTSFRKVKEKRDYHQFRSSVSWLYLDRLAAAREYAMMKALYECGLPVPQPLAWNRSAVVMEYLKEGVQLSRVTAEDLGDSAPRLYREAIGALVKMATLGLVHGDLNEFNLVIQFLNKEDEVHDLPDPTEDTLASCDIVLRVIDFPQMVSREHPSADELYRRDRKGLVEYFKKLCDISNEVKPPKTIFEIERSSYLDVRLRAPGYPKKEHFRKSRGWYDDLLEKFSSVQLGSTTVDDSSEEEEEDGDDECLGAEDNKAQEDDEEENDKESLSGSDCQVISASCEQGADSNSDADSESEENPAGKTSNKSDTQKIRKGHHGIFPEDLIKERIRRERSKVKDHAFHSRLKRQMRATQKKDDRLNIKDSLNWS